MTPDRLKRIEELYHGALERTPDERAEFVRAACGTDADLQLSVEQLLAANEAPNSLLDHSIWNEAGERSSGTEGLENQRLGPYQVISKLGAGGMGSVFLAEDTRLGRKVAIKMSHARYSQRFEREARAIAALSHPCICTLYDVGSDFLVMELLDGETLAERMRRGRIPTDDVLRYGRQIADALAEAHAHGVAHRDLKPGNIMLTSRGLKVLDFGLAKVAPAAGQPATESQAVMGTPAYWAPEQARGEPAGQAADLFSLGLILYEMAEGEPPVSGSLGSARANGVEVRIAFRAGGHDLPKPVQSLIAELLETDPQRRPPKAARVRDRIAASPEKKPNRMVRWAAVAALAILVAAGTWYARQGSTSSREMVQLSKVTSLPGEERDPAFSPDGRSIAFSWNGEPGDKRQIYRITGPAQAPVRVSYGEGNDISPAWSPDGKQIAFLRLKSVAFGSLMVVPAGGGPEREVRDMLLDENIYRSQRPLLAWTPDGNGLVYTSQDQEIGRVALYVTNLAGTEVRRWVASGENTLGITAPAFARDGKWLAYVEVYGPFQGKLFVRPVGPGLQFSGQASLVYGRGDTLIMSPVWSPDSSRLAFVQGSSILEWVRGGDAKKIYVGAGRSAGLTATWDSRQALRVVTTVEDHKELHLLPLRAGGLVPSGDAKPFAVSTNNDGNPAFSPDGKGVAFISVRSGASELWFADAKGVSQRQLTRLNASILGYPRWSPDSKRIAFHAWLGPKPQIFIVDVERNLGEPGSQIQKVSDSAFGFIAPSWSPDEKYIYVNRMTGGSRTLRIPANGGEPQDLFEGAVAVATPDGHHIIYGKIGHLGIFSRSLDGDPTTNSEEKLVDDYRPPGSDLSPFPDGFYYVGWYGEGQPRRIRFYSYAQKRSVDVAVVPGPMGSPQGLTVAADRRSLVYAQLTGSGMDLIGLDFR